MSIFASPKIQINSEAMDYYEIQPFVVGGESSMGTVDAHSEQRSRSIRTRSSIKIECENS